MSITKEPTSQLSGRLCSNPKFQQRLGVTCAEDAAAKVRAHCKVASRKELDWNQEAAELFHELRKRLAYGEAV